MSDELENYFFNSEDPELELLTDEQREEIKLQSMDNTFTLITNNYDFEVFPNKLFWLLTDYDALTVFDVLIDYYSHSDREEYEKCALLIKIKERHERHNKSSRAAKKGMFTYQLGIVPDDDGENPPS